MEDISFHYVPLGYTQLLLFRYLYLCKDSVSPSKVDSKYYLTRQQMFKAGLSESQSAKHGKTKFVTLMLPAKEFLIIPSGNETSERP